MPSSEQPATQIVGRYALYGEIASGGMATVHYGRLLGPAGFSRTVAIKRLHPAYAKDPEFVSMFLDEARLAARIRHPNVVPTLDVVATSGELFLVMEYVQGESLGRLVRAMSTRGETAPPSVVASVMTGVLHGLHSAHEATSERGEPLGIVHRDVSPQNVLVGTDGVGRVLDFGVAKAVGRLQTTREGQIKGKLAYMPPEQLRGQKMTRQADIYAAAVVLWETLTSRRLFSGDNEGVIVAKILDAKVDAPSRLVPGLPKALDDVTLRGLSRDPSKRFATAREMALALEKCGPLAPASEIGDWVETMAHQVLSVRAKRVAEIESSSSSGMRLEPSVSAITAAGDSGEAPNFVDYVQAASRTQTSPAKPARPSGSVARPPSMPVVPSSDLPRFDDPDIPVDQEGLGTSTGAQLSSSLSRSRMLAKSPSGKLAMAFVGAIAVGLFAGSYALSRSGSGKGNVRAADDGPLGEASASAYAQDPARAPEGGVGGQATGASPWPEVAVDKLPKTNVPQGGSTPQTAPGGGSHRTWHPKTAPPPPTGTTVHKDKQDCDPPYTLDDQGHRQYKMQCLSQ